MPRKKPRRQRNRQLALEEERTILAEEQTLLAKERTILSFMQTGLAFIALGVVIINVFQTMSSEIVGWILVLIGFVEIVECLRRFARYKKKIETVKRKVGRKWV